MAEGDSGLDLLTAVLVAIIVVTLTVLLKVFWTKFTKKKKVVVLFIDAPDPDNPACAASIIKHIFPEPSFGVEPHLHVVLTGREVDLETAKKPGKDGDILRQDGETNEPEHAQKVLEDAAARLSNYLTNCKVDAKITFYDGGVAPCAPLSDKVHDWDFLFDRKDLITDVQSDQGTILTPEEYKDLVDTYNKCKADERAEKLLALLRPYKLTPLDSLKEILEKSGEIILFLGGPATAVVQLFKGEDPEAAALRSKVISLYGMFGALFPGINTLLPNQFNVACDVEAASDLFVGDLFPKAIKYLITTETAKNNTLLVSAADLEENNVAPYFTDLQKLWESTHKGDPQPLFDVLPVMAFMPQYKECFKWSMKKAVLTEMWKSAGKDKLQLFAFADLDDSQAQHKLFVSEPEVDKISAEDVVLFLLKTWPNTAPEGSSEPTATDEPTATENSPESGDAE